MPLQSARPSAGFEISEDPTGGKQICLEGRIDIHSVPGLLRRLRRALASGPAVPLRVNLENVDYLDDAGAVVLFEIRTLARIRKVGFTMENPTGQVSAILDLVGFDNPSTTAPIFKRPKENMLARLGSATIAHADHLRFMVSFVGSVALSFLRVLILPRQLRLGDTVSCMEKTGVNALPIVALISFLLGLVMAFMSSLQLKQFGANVYVASLVSIAMVSELGPIMTAIVVAGRSGSAFAAEIGTMKISEEIDALVVMGFEPTLFLAVPRILAALIVVPLLTLFSDIFAIAGGLVVGVFMLDLTLASYMAKTIEALTLFEVAWGMGKSVVFAGIIAWVGCLRGFQTRGGADAVGNAATSAVVTSIFLIILFDSAFAVMRSYW